MLCDLPATMDTWIGGKGVFVGVGAGDVGQAEFGQWHGADAGVGSLALRAQAQGSVVGAGQIEAGAVHGSGAAPATGKVSPTTRLLGHFHCLTSATELLTNFPFRYFSI